jgi:hypothetical protein
MTTSSRFRFWAMAFGLVAAGAVLAGGSSVAESLVRAGTTESPLVASSGCPAGEVVDEEATGFRCVSQCPAGMMVDAQTHVCVAAPGVPPALPEVQIIPTPQI